MKAEIHCHLEGAANPKLVQRLAKKYKVNMDDVIKQNKYVWNEFSGFLKAYDRVASVFRCASDYRLLAYDVFMNLAEQDAIYGEVFVAPDICPHIPAPEFIDAVAQGINDATTETGIEGRMIITAIRHLGSEAAENLANWIADNPHPVVTGFGMAGDERMYEIQEFQNAYEIAEDAGLGLTIHAGEFKNAESVKEAIENLNVTRIGHGVRAIENMEIVKQIVKEKIVLEVCVSSNVELGIYQNFKQHPIQELVKQGVRVCINSDDPPFFDTALKKEYEIAKKYLGFNDTMLKQCTKTAIEAAFVDEKTKKFLMKKIRE